MGALSRSASTLEELLSSFTGIYRFSYSIFSEEGEYPNIGKILDEESAILYLSRKSEVYYLPIILERQDLGELLMLGSRE